MYFTYALNHDFNDVTSEIVFFPDRKKKVGTLLTPKSLATVGKSSISIFTKEMVAWSLLSFSNIGAIFLWIKKTKWRKSQPSEKRVLMEDCFHEVYVRQTYLHGGHHEAVCGAFSYSGGIEMPCRVVRILYNSNKSMDKHTGRLLSSGEQCRPFFRRVG